MEETGAWLRQQARTGSLPAAAAAGDADSAAAAVASMYHLTGGNTRELRRHGAGLLY